MRESIYFDYSESKNIIKKINKLTPPYNRIKYVTEGKVLGHMAGPGKHEQCCRRRTT